MQNFDTEDGLREYLNYSNQKLNIQANRPNIRFNNEKDLIFMKIDIDCDMITPFYGNK